MDKLDIEPTIKETLGDLLMNNIQLAALNKELQREIEELKKELKKALKKED